jgi:hypothetical protein
MARKTRLQQEYKALYPDCRDIYERLIRGEDPAAIEKRLGPRALFQEVREAYLGIAEHDQALRGLLGAPETLPLTQWYMEVPVKDRRLAGCQWRLVGTVLPAGLAPDDRPPYPFFQYGYPEPRRLQVWLWRVFKPRPPPHPRRPPPSWFRPFGDIRWRPGDDPWLTMELRPSDGPDVARQVWTWLHASELSSRGRLLFSGTYHSAEEFLRDVLPAIRRARAHKVSIGDRREVTQREVMDEMGWSGDTARLREQIRDWVPSWDWLLSQA